MTEAVAVALIVAVPSTIVASTGAIVAFVGLRRGNHTGKAVAAQGIVQAEIRKDVNSNTADLLTKIDDGARKIEAGKNEIEALKSAAVQEIKNEMVSLKQELADRDYKRDNGDPPPRRRRRH